MQAMATPTPTGVVVDPAFLQALENQRRRLQAVIERVDQVRGTVPSPQSGIWRGPAHSLYASSVEGLVAEFGAIGARLEAALAATRTALSIVADQG